MNLTLSSVRWFDVARSFIIELFARNALWIVRAHPDLAVTNQVQFLFLYCVFGKSEQNNIL